jgi:hypothetical protein
MTIRLTLLTITIFAGLISCSRKSKSTCGFDYFVSRASINSKVINFERVAIADTTIALVSGTILGHDLTARSSTTDPLPYSKITAVDKKTGQIVVHTTDLHGNFQFPISASTYDLTIPSIGYNTLIIRDVFFGTGDIVEFTALLGQCGAAVDSCVFQMQADRTLKEVYTPKLKK